MQVGELIRKSVWQPSRDHDTARPLVSVLLPTFRRGRDGSFLRAANSILHQSLRNLELLIIDDGSTDGTAQQIASLMAADARVSCVTHPENIGLPAISEYEGFLHARGDYIAFGFDDFIFDDHAIAGLMAFPLTSSRSVVHGYAAWLDRAGHQHFYGKDDTPHARLRFYNFLANATFLVPRAILQDVGLFDPHIAAARLCDWDLWRRILKKYPIHRAAVFVGVEYGHTRDDSLENTYPLLEEAMQEYFSADRDELLKPESLPDLDVWKLPERPSAVLTAHILKARQFFSSRLWTKALPFSSDAAGMIEPKRATIGIFGELDAPLAHAFDELPEQSRREPLYIHPDLTDAQLAYYLAGCSAIVMASHASDARSVQFSAMCAAIGVPIYYLTDDNPRAVHDEAGRSAGSVADLVMHERPVNALDWVVRLRKLLEHVTHRAVLAEARLEQAEAELSERSVRLAAAEVQLASRSYRLALKVRGLANAVRKMAGRLHLR